MRDGALFEDELLTVTGAARLLRVHPRDVLEGAANGSLPAHYLGRQPYFDRAELMAALATPHPDSSSER
ncbi:hypothetical protein GCM10027446_01660 [Angustibacter peucedani]